MGFGLPKIKKYKNIFLIMKRPEKSVTNTVDN